MLYELLLHLIPPSVIIMQLANDLLTQVDEALRPELIHWTALYEHQLQTDTCDCIVTCIGIGA
ncbi:hypothetical protein PSHT_15222 [Puccinia striiformis]|uniref:Uncharacterized protein n=3 Tax=Puccinia striiformis TaxID=27350 RepID=A0A2S4UGE7_9BASI|nr:hypothetical protein PSHT_15222 [Puccinia striiformis]